MAAASIIGRGTTIRGNLRGGASIEIRGRVEGDVEVEGDVAIGEDGAVNGSVSGAQILVAGQVAGDLTGSEAVMLERGARVVGDLVAPRIGIADGALVRGSVRTEGDAPAPRRAAVVPTRRADGFSAKPKSAPAPVPAKAPAATAAPPKANETPALATPAPVSAPIAAAEPPAGPPAPVVPSLGKGVKGKKKAKRS